MQIYQYVLITILIIVIEIVYLKIANRLNIVDKPNLRSSYKTPVICGGGIIFLFAIWLWTCFCGFQYPWFLIGVTLIAAISFVDDIHPLPVSLRLLVQVISMGMIFQEWNILFWPNWWILFLAFILCVGIINAYNFMDGINGILGGYSMAVLLPLLFLNHKYSFVEFGLIEVMAIAGLVFCFFNFRKRALCCAGDVGSVGMAFFVVFVIGKLIITTGDFSYIILLALYGVDSILTIIHRIMLHENLGQAHRKHCYQLMANELQIPHVKVSLFYTFTQLLISTGFILTGNNIKSHYIYSVVVVVCLIMAYILFMKKYYHLHEEYLKKMNNEYNHS